MLSIREGSDWVESIAYRGDHQKAPDFSPTCKDVRYGRSTCENYKNYAPEDDKSVGRAWWVIRHENVIKDTCAMLARMGLECPTELAKGHPSRKSFQDMLNCKKPDMKKLQKEIDCINDVNRSPKH